VAHIKKELAQEKGHSLFGKKAFLIELERSTPDGQKKNTKKTNIPIAISKTRKISRPAYSF
jgi:hypothetical protein